MSVWDSWAPPVFLDPPAALWTFPSRRPVRPPSLCALCRRTASRGKAASANICRCPAARCLCEKTLLRASSAFIWRSRRGRLLSNFFFVCFRRWSADEARILRVSVNSFLDHLSLVLETMEMFGPPVSQWTPDNWFRTILIPPLELSILGRDTWKNNRLWRLEKEVWATGSLNCVMFVLNSKIWLSACSSGTEGSVVWFLLKLPFVKIKVSRSERNRAHWSWNGSLIDPRADRQEMNWPLSIKRFSVFCLQIKYRTKQVIWRRHFGLWETFSLFSNKQADQSFTLYFNPRYLAFINSI